jgi:hypothetical protein
MLGEQKLRTLDCKPRRGINNCTDQVCSLMENMPVLAIRPNFATATLDTCNTTLALLSASTRCADHAFDAPFASWSMLAHLAGTSTPTDPTRPTANSSGPYPTR